jgi:UDP-glucose:(heptosyl)LPS alpha-1,3-glucosyltransferase
VKQVQQVGDSSAPGASFCANNAAVSHPSQPRAATVIAREVRQDGGQERAMFETIQGMLAAGVRVRLIAQVNTLPAHAGLTWIRVGTPRRPFPIGYPLFVLTASLVLSLTDAEGEVITLGASVINRVDAITVQFCQAAFRRQDIIRSSKDSPVYRLSTRISRELALLHERWCYRPSRVKRMSAVSELVREELRTYYELDAIPVEVIPNGVDIRRFRPDAQLREQARRELGLALDRPVALFVGGDWQRKGLDIAIDAVAATRSDWKLLVVGRGDSAVWETRAEQAGADVTFVPHIPDPERIFRCADAFVFPSRYEGFALATIEASASGLPLLVTRATGAGPLAESAGMAVLPHEAAAYAAVLDALADNPSARARLSRRAREQAERLAWPRVVEQYVGFYLDGSGAAR